MSIYLDDPNIDIHDMVAVQKTLCDKNISTVGDQRGEFEKAISAYLGGNVHCIATNSGTSAIFSALKVLDIGPGDEVIIPATTFVATMNAVTMTGARPVIVDIDPNTWNIDPAEIEKAITIKTKAIVVVHLYGNPCDMDAITDIAYIHDLFVIEDACQSLGATYKGKQTGTIGRIGCFSFNRNKIITTGGGGMLVAWYPEDIDKARKFINQGRDKDGNVAGHGFNFGMVNQNAALGLSQMERLSEFLENKNAFNDVYYKMLEEWIAHRIIKMQFFHKESSPSFWFTAVKINTDNLRTPIAQLKYELEARGIPTRRIFKPLADLPNARELYEKGLCLPSSTLNTLDDVEYVAMTLLEVLA